MSTPVNLPEDTLDHAPPASQSRSPLPSISVGKPLRIQRPTNAGLIALLDKEDAERAAQVARCKP